MAPKSVQEKELTRPISERMSKKPEVIAYSKVGDRLIQSILKSKGNRKKEYAKQLTTAFHNLCVTKYYHSQSKQECYKLEELLELQREKTKALQLEIAKLKASQ